MFKTFFEWMGNNPNGFPIKEVIVSNVFLFIVLIPILLIGCWLFLKRVSFKLLWTVILVSLVVAPYLFFMFCWDMCFMGSNSFVAFVPYCPLIIGMLVFLLCWCKKPDSCEQKETV